ncbi:MAG: hypothetical protein PVJ55_02435 [Anaerolineae bacterium]
MYRLANWRFAPALFQGVRLLYYVGIPSAALFWGRDAVVGRFLGLQRLILPGPAGGSPSIGANWSAWAHDLGWAAVLGLGSAGLLLLAGLTHRKVLSEADGISRGERARGMGTAREAFYHEIHWAFYRNAPIVALGTYWGTWAGLAIVAVEAASNPGWRGDLRDRVRSWPRLWRGALIVVSAVLFLRAQNLWLASLVHWGVSWVLKTVQAEGSPVPSRKDPVGQRDPEREHVSEAS